MTAFRCSSWRHSGGECQTWWLTLLGETKGMMAGISVGVEVARGRVPVTFGTHPVPWKFLKEVGVGHVMVIKEM